MRILDSYERAVHLDHGTELLAEAFQHLAVASGRSPPAVDEMLKFIWRDPSPQAEKCGALAALLASGFISNRWPIALSLEFRGSAGEIP